MSDYLRNEIMRVLQGHRGRPNAMPRDRLMEALKLFKPELNDRDFRKLYTVLPVCSCSDGLFLPTSTAEVLEFRDYLSRGPGGPITAWRRYATILSFYPQLAPPAEQLHLGI
jgi:hypothetical protein